MLTRAYSDRYASISLQAILNHRKGETAREVKSECVYVNNQNKLRKSTKGWDLEVLWIDRTTDWLTLEDLNKANLVEEDERASTRKI